MVDHSATRLADVTRDVTLIGGGKMGTALLAGWLDAGLDSQRVQVVEPRPSDALLDLASHHRLRIRDGAAAMRGEVVVLATKPQSVDAVTGALSVSAWKGCLVLSIMAGVRIARLRTLFSGARSIVRAMPNLPAAIGFGATAFVAEGGTAEADTDMARRLLAVSGHVEELVGEDLMDAATALSGSGPGYLFYLVDCLADAGERAGLPKDAALRLARRTVEGAGALLSASPKSARELREDVTSAGGTTQAGLAVLARDGQLTALLTDTVLAAAARARVLAG